MHENHGFAEAKRPVGVPVKQDPKEPFNSRTKNGSVRDICFGLKVYEEQKPIKCDSTPRGDGKRKEQIGNLEENDHELRQKKDKAPTEAYSKPVRHSKG
ncbi:hypothetical protein BWQ96_07879 [Gracilariopsis chorda]|uniref:Uncharacterized protein n=1 Tax=Gracilariopsis chorda TaxID=448386 RepID=A0A2V3IJY1_9FLOR|nr:hypothetical protein BWQ96_07879 [Gracilariopsis chorda]|eukprot:PXF42359.1 hypothetical protein BWQ96_07879 [Gracilariopsis chorda]